MTSPLLVPHASRSQRLKCVHKLFSFSVFFLSFLSLSGILMSPKDLWASFGPGENRNIKIVTQEHKWAVKIQVRIRWTNVQHTQRREGEVYKGADQ